MTGAEVIAGVASGLGLALLILLFAAYRNPLFEIYLSNWGLC